MSLSFSVAVGGVRRYIRYVILFCVTIVMVGTMVLTTYTASADSSIVMPLRYNAEARAKAKAYSNLLVFCWNETEEGELQVNEALNGSWRSVDEDGDINDVNNDVDEYIFGKGRFECSSGSIIAEAFNYFASISGGNIKPWNQWSIDEKKELFCGMFKVNYDGTTTDGSYNDCSAKIDLAILHAGDNKGRESFFIKNLDNYKGVFSLDSYLERKLNNEFGEGIIKPYSNDEKYYVYKSLIKNYCTDGSKWIDVPDVGSGVIRVINFNMSNNALRIQPKWSIVTNLHTNVDFLVRSFSSNGGATSTTDTVDKDCHEDRDASALNFLVDEPTDDVVVAEKDTMVEFLKRDCERAYVDFYNAQRDYKNTLTGDLTEVQIEYIAWFDGLVEPRNWDLDANSCIENWPDSWPTNPTEWSNITIFECKIEEYIHGLLSTNPDPDSPDWSGYTIPDLPSDDYDNTSSSTRTDPCYQSAGALGWAICPIMSSLSNTLTSIYEDMVEPFLAVNPRLLGAEAKSVVDKVSTFANIAIIIFLLVIIFSQLTGVGIDNYGIKKSLPKLIVTVILVNLSFVICQVAVDLSNIVGSGANSMLSGVDVSITTCNDVDGGVSNGVTLNVPGGRQCVPADVSSGSEAGMFRTLVDIASVGLAGVGAIGVGSIILGVASSGWLAGLIIPVLLLLITAVIAVLFFFVLLGVRQAGVVILAVLSPLALVCYMLPNTKRYFDKWKKAFTGLLVLYPICGLLIGGGQLAAKILISASQDYVTYFAGCLIMVVPFFFIPSLLKGSFAAMGNIGAKISGFGKSLGSRGRGRVEGAFKNSDRYKNRVDFNQKRAAERRAERTVSRLGRRSGGNVANLSRRQQARMAAANSVLDERAKRQRENEQKSDLSYRGAMDAKVELESEESRRNLSDYNNIDFVHAKQEQSRLSHDENFQDALLYGDARFRAAQHTKSQNARIERQAEADVGVLSLNSVLARSRAESRRDAQELKAYQDQFAGFNQAQLRAEMGSAGTWLSQQGGSQRMSALISAMEANGMERDIFSMIKSNNISGDSGVMQTLAASNNKVLKAYGKKGQGTDYNTFMTGTGAGSLQGYINEKGKDFINGLDDKALAEIASFNGGSAMSTDLLIEAAAKINSQDAINQIDGLLFARRDFNGNISGEQLVQFNDSTVNKLMGNAQARAAMDKATDAIAGNPNLVGKLSANRKQQFNVAFRNGTTKPYM